MALSSDELKKITEQLKSQAEFQRKLNEDTVSYSKLIKDIKLLHKNISDTKKIIAQQEEKSIKANKEFNDALSSGNKLNQTQYNLLKKNKEIEEAKLNILKNEVTELEKLTVELTRQAKEASNISHVFSNIKKDIVGITTNVKQNYGRFKTWSKTFEIDKSIRVSATQMGLLTKQTNSFRDSLDYAGSKTAAFGVGIGELAKLQSEYSDELGRSVMLGQDGLEAIAKISKATGLGAEGAARMAASMEQQGLSAERTSEFVEKTMNDSSKMGINASKVIKNIQANMKMLNRYNFKDGYNGLARMAQTVTKLGVSMEFAAGMADKLFDIEGAVDMTSQLQVMGGAWAKLADPFKLMYMARNDMEGLVEELGKAAESSVHFNKKSGDFEISALEMHKLRKVAEQTGVAYEELATAGKNAAKATFIKKQLNFSVSKEVQDFLATTSKLDKNGNATIEIEGQPKLLKSLSSLDESVLKKLIDEKSSLDERAKASQTFDEKITNLINQLKQFLLPMVDSLSKGLTPVVEKLSKTLSDPKFISGIKSAAETAGRAIAVVGKFMANNPGTAMVTAIAGIGLMQTAKWYLNGQALGTGFNSVAKSGGMGSDNTGFFKGKGGRIASGGGTGLITGGLNALSSDSVGEGIGNVAGGALGGILGTFLDPFIGPLGTILGAQLGSMAGGWIGDKIGGGKHDAMFNSPIHDGILPKLDNDFSKGRGIIQGGKITPIDNKDDIMAMKPNGPVDKVIKNKNTESIVKIEFGDIKFDGEIKLTSPGSPGIALDLLKDPIFVQNMSRIVHIETAKVINGGKVKG